MEAADPLEMPQCLRSNPSAQLPPFPTLIGEHPLLISRTIDGNAMITNFRFCVCEKRSFINIQLMRIGELFMIEAARRLRIGCKDGSSYSCTFATSEDCQACTSMLREKSGVPQSPIDIFAYRFYALAMYRQSLRSSLTKNEKENILLCQPVKPAFAYNFDKEVERLGFDTGKQKLWRISHANEHFEFCPTYPKLHILPATVDNDKLKVSLDFRALKRFPSVVWRDKRTGMVLIRSSQPLSSFLGVSYFTNHADVFLIEEIVSACNRDWLAIVQEKQRSGHVLPGAEFNICGQENGHGDISNSNSVKEDGAQGSLMFDAMAVASDHGASNGTLYCGDSTVLKKLAIVDCRSLAGVWGNSFKGGGTEDEVVYKCNIVHLDLANIHTVRDSFNKLRALCHAYVEGTFLKNLAGCMWLTYVTALLRGANIVVELMHVMKRPVLVHCSDGWDRTSQIVSLSELMMDSYYRTLEGFQVLVEREWLHFGHKFGERGGHDPKCSDTNQISPIFLQFLDCVYQLTQQYPAEFQFNEAYLVKLLHHTQSCLFGNFLHNCQKERENLHQKTASVWTLLRLENMRFVNLLYKPSVKVLTSKFSEHDIVLWKSVYMAGLSPLPHVSQTDFYNDCNPAGGGEEMSNISADGMPRSKSVDDLSKVNADGGRRNITQNHEIAAAAPNTSSVHNELSSSEHFPEDSASNDMRLSKPEESCKVSSQKTSPGSSATNDHNHNARGSLVTFHNGESSIEVTSTQEAQDSCAIVTNHHKSDEVTPLSHEEACVSGHYCEAELVNIDRSNEKKDLFLAEDSVLQLLAPFSSSEFCLETEIQGICEEHTLCCDKQGTDVNIEISFERKPIIKDRHISFSNGRDKGCIIVRSKSMDSIVSPNTTSKNGMTTSGCISEKTTVLTKHLARSGESNVVENCKTMDINTRNMDDIMKHLSIENRQSVKSNDINDTFTSNTQVNVSRKTSLDSSQMVNLCSHSNTLGTNYLRSDTVSCQSFESLEMYGINGTRTSVNSTSLDALTNLLETEVDSGDSTFYSMPLNISIRSEKNLLSTPKKGDNYPLEVKVGHKLNLMSRLTRAASGASRDFSISTCTCCRLWSGTCHKCHHSGSEIITRRLPGTTVATSTTDISDSHVGQPAVAAVDRHSSIKQHIDTDGLTLFVDERQNLLAELLAEKDHKIMVLKHRLHQAAKVIMALDGSSSKELQDTLLSGIVTDLGEGYLLTCGACSNAASDASWETSDETEAKVMLLVPDTVVTHCAECDDQFWIYKCKHHCRNCAQVFCKDCSRYLATITKQDMNSPKIICRWCYSHILQLSPGASSDGRIPTPATDY